MLARCGGGQLGGRGVFSHALEKDLLIPNTGAKDVIPLLPLCYRQRIPLDRYLLLLPLSVDEKPFGLLYLDGPREELRAISPSILNCLRVLRGQAVLAVRRQMAAAHAERGRTAAPGATSRKVS